MEHRAESSRSYNDFDQLDAAAQNLKLGQWLCGADTAIGRLESTKWGLKTARAGQLARSKWGPAYIYGYALIGAIVWCGQRDMLPSSVLDAARATQTTLPNVVLGAMGAVALAKAAALAYRDRAIYADARQAGLGRVESTRVYGRLLGKQAAALAPNPHTFAVLGMSLLKMLCKKAGMDAAANKMASAVANASLKSAAFADWRAGAAKEARLMVNSETRSIEAYRECARFLLASRMGHFGLAVDAPLADEEMGRLREALAPGFERMAPTRPSYGLLAEGEKPKSSEASGQTKSENMAKKFEIAQASHADPLYAPEPGLPVLSQLMRLCLGEVDLDYDPPIALGDFARIQQAFAPWGSALEALELGLALDRGRAGDRASARTGAKRI